MHVEPLRKGDSGDRVALLSNTLFRLGLLSSPSSEFDAAVESAVKAFQQNRGLTVTGILDSESAQVLEEARWKLGERTLLLTAPALMRGADVAQLHSRLSELGCTAGRVDGIFGKLTESALLEFQRSAGVVIDGHCGPSTVMAMLRLMKVVSGGATAQLREQVAREGKGPALAGKVIVLDPGSLCADPFITFDIAQRLEGRLIALGVTVFITRSATSDPSVQERIEKTNNASADLLISFAIDSYINEKAHGVATFYYGADAHGVHSVVGERFANLVQREITARTDLLNCRTHAKTWDLLRRTKAPTVQIDLGYSTHPGDMKRLLDPQFRETIVESLMIAIQRLYLSAEDDAKTGTLKISDLRRAGIRK